MEPETQDHGSPVRQPIFNVPGVVLAWIVVTAGIHLLVYEVLDPEQAISFLYSFAFIPARFVSAGSAFGPDWSAFWTPLSYSFLHADWTHLIVNSVWILAFGSVLARRFGVTLFLVFCAAGSIAGAAAHLIANSGSPVPMIGASAVVSACMGAAVRFAFPGQGTFSVHAHAGAASSLSQTMRNPTILAFVGVWFLINLMFGLSGELVAGAGSGIAWQAHIGGFLVGLLGFGFFDRFSILKK